MRYLLVRTHTEEFEYEPTELLAKFPLLFEQSKQETIKIRERHGYLALTEDEHIANFLIELFELYDGSQFGDSLFSSTASDNVGIELVTRGEDE